MNHQQRTAMQWTIVALMALLAIASFLASFYHRRNRDLIARSDWGRRQRHRSLGHVTENVLLCNGLANICDIPANRIVYATLHNANSAFVRGSLIVKNHVRGVRQALQAGYRGLNFDIGKCFGKVRLDHGSCLLTSTDLHQMLERIVNFLDENPHEVIILPTEITNPILGISERVTLAEIEAVFNAVPGWNERLYQHPGPGQPWPTLRELIAADTRVLFFHYNGESCTVSVDCPLGFHPWFRYAAETQFSFASVPQLRNEPYACNITRGGASSSTLDFFGVNVFVSPPRKLAAARVTNRADFLRRHLDACTAINGGLPVGLILINFWGIGDLLDVVREMNEALPG
jgi:hypothetical protein